MNITIKREFSNSPKITFCFDDVKLCKISNDKIEQLDKFYDNIQRNLSCNFEYAMMKMINLTHHYSGGTNVYSVLEYNDGILKNVEQYVNIDKNNEIINIKETKDKLWSDKNIITMVISEMLECLKYSKYNDINDPTKYSKNDVTNIDNSEKNILKYTIKKN